MQRLGKFLLIERLGRGGMAEVWKARITGPMGFARKVVVKRILPELVEEPRFVEMFVAEARLSACLNHANIVQVYELGAVDGEYFLAMEYVHGRDLMALLRVSRPIAIPPVGMAAFVARDVCRALACAHSLTADDGTPLCVIHRDVSPSNVMLGFDGAVKLLDFGIAKALAETDVEGSHSGVLKGKLGYVAPEQLELGVAVDARADQFSAGVILWEMLAGRRLFKGPNEMHALEVANRGEVTPPSAANPEVPAELERICLKMLEHDRERRYAGCAEAAAELDEVVLALKWGPERLAQLMRQAFPNANETQPVPILDLTPAAHAPPTPVTVGSPRRRRSRGRWVGMATVLTFLVGGVTWLMALERSPPASARAPGGTTSLVANAPPNAATPTGVVPPTSATASGAATRGANGPVAAPPKAIPAAIAGAPASIERSKSRGAKIIGADTSGGAATLIGAGAPDGSKPASGAKSTEAPLRDRYSFAEPPARSDEKSPPDARATSSATRALAALRGFARSLGFAWAADADAAPGAASPTVLAATLPIATRAAPPSAAPARGSPATVSPIRSAPPIASPTRLSSPSVSPMGAASSTAAPIRAVSSTVTVSPTVPVVPTVVVRVFTRPAGAHVVVDDETRPRGRTPLALTLPRSETARTIKLLASGYRAASVEVTPSVDGQLHFALERRARSRRRP